MTCPLCNDTGWKYVGPESERRVARCQCRRAQHDERLLEQAHIPPRYQHCDLFNFQTEFEGIENKSLSDAKFKAGEFAKRYPAETQTGLLFVGRPGIGKTHLAVGVLKELIRKGFPCLFCDYRKLLKSIQDSYNPSVETTEMEVLRPVMNAEILVLDELGAVKPTEWVWDIVSLILNTRYNDSLTTIITTNLPDQPPRDSSGTDNPRSKKAADYAATGPTLGDRITEPMRSRLQEMCRKIEMTGEDFRPHVKKL